MSPRPSATEERTNQILDAATAVFARAGFAEARMDDIARQARLGKGTLYLYFESKDAIIAALMRRIFEVQLEDLRALAASPEPVAGRLLAFTDHLFRVYENMGVKMPVAREFFAVAARQRSVRKFIRDYYRSYIELLARLIRQGIDGGEFRSVDPNKTATTILGVYEGLFLLWASDPGGVRWAETTEVAIDLLLHGMKRGPKPERSG